MTLAFRHRLDSETRHSTLTSSLDIQPRRQSTHIAWIHNLDPMFHTQPRRPTSTLDLDTQPRHPPSTLNLDTQLQHQPRQPTSIFNLDPTSTPATTSNLDTQPRHPNLDSQPRHQPRHPTSTLNLDTKPRHPTSTPSLDTQLGRPDRASSRYLKVSCAEYRLQPEIGVLRSFFTGFEANVARSECASQEPVARSGKP